MVGIKSKYLSSILSKKHTWIKTVPLLAVALTLFCSGEVFAATPKSGGTLRVGMYRVIKDLQPNINQGASTYLVQQNVYDNLLGFAPPNGTFDPELAVSWDIVDPITYVFHLRKGVVFHDGSKFDAEDVKYSIERMMNPKSGATLAKQLTGIQSVTILDSHRVQVKLKQPHAAFISLMASRTAHITDKEWMEAGHDLKTEMNGTGPFVFGSHEPGVAVVLEKNKNFWKKGMPYLDRIEMVPINDESARINALRSNEVQFIEYVPWVEIAQLENDPDFSMYKGFTPFNLIRFNVTKPPFDDVRVRQAMNYMIDRDQLITLAFGGEGIPIKSALIYPGTPFYNKEVERWSYQPEKALALLKQAGYKGFSDFSFVLTSYTASVHQDSAEAIQGMLRALGVKVSLIPQDIPTLLDNRKTGNYTAMMDGLSNAYFDPDAYSYYFQSGSIGHAKGSGFSDAKLDALLNKGRKEVDFEKRKKIYAEFETRLLDLAPWFFGFFRPQGEAMPTFIKGYKRLPGDLGTSSTSRFEYLWIDK